MARKVKLYEVYDVHKNEWLPDQYKMNEVLEIVKVNINVSKTAREGYVVRGRYKIFFAGIKEMESSDSLETIKEWTGFDFGEFAKEWDAIRKVIMPQLRQEPI